MLCDGKQAYGQQVARPGQERFVF